MNHRAFGLIACLSLVATTAYADVITTSATTAGGSKFNRPLEDLSGLSAIGTAVPYATTQISVSVAGAYTFLTAGTYDTFAILYSPTFNPMASLSNAMAANDDLFTVANPNSGFAYSLAANTNYLLVNTGFTNTDFGPFVNTIGGPGVITATPPAFSAAPANIFTYTGDTTGGPRFNRLLEDLSGPSAVGTNVAYDRFNFTVGASGSYAFTSTAANAARYDTFDLLYDGSFNPAAPRNGALAADDDLFGVAQSSGLTFNLIAGHEYSFITTGFTNTDLGAFSTTINGPGAIIRDAVGTAVPEPSVSALLAGGVFLMAWAARRRPRRQRA